MEMEIIQNKGIKIAVLKSDNILIKETQDALDLMVESGFHDSGKIIINEKQLISEFFDLKSGLAGDILQKFSTYNVQLAIIGDFSKYSSKSLKDFIFESNKNEHINFVRSMEEAIERLTK
jgi:hypothetical protein